MSAGVGQQALRRRDFGRVQEGLLVVGLKLEDLLVEGAGFRQESLAAQVAGDAGEELDGAVDLPGAHVEIAECVGAVPVARLIVHQPLVLGNRRIKLALSEQLFCVSQRGGAIESH